MYSVYFLTFLKFDFVFLKLLFGFLVHVMFLKVFLLL